MAVNELSPRAQPKDKFFFYIAIIPWQPVNYYYKRSALPDQVKLHPSDEHPHLGYAFFLFACNS